MKRIFISPDTAELGLLRNILQHAGIRCVELNEHLAQTLPVTVFQAELWVEEESDYDEAVALTRQWVNPDPVTGSSWTCSRCGEELGAQFGKCWKCGTRRDTPPPRLH
ncbi:MAG: DUF2007 domain-containing protein [Verrucomicrobiota bacterium]